MIAPVLIFSLPGRHCRGNLKFTYSISSSQATSNYLCEEEFNTFLMLVVALIWERSRSSSFYSVRFINLNKIIESIGVGGTMNAGRMFSE